MSKLQKTTFQIKKWSLYLLWPDSIITRLFDFHESEDVFATFTSLIMSSHCA